MKLLSVMLARSVWLINTYELNPRGRNLYPLISSFLIDNYKFKKYPKTIEDFNEKEGVIFDHGEFENKEGEPIFIKLIIRNFGIMAETRSSTVDNDFFLETLYNQMTKTLKFPNYDSIMRGRDYLSQVYITTDKELELINPKLSAISDYLSTNISNIFDAKYQLGSLSFWPDPVNPVDPFSFVFERQAASPFLEKRYFSSAPLQTDQHLELLDKLENILS